MSRPWALTNTAQYALVYREGRTYLDDLVVMKVLPNGLKLSRCGFSVSAKVGKAVQRNRMKRLLKETVRLQLIKPGWDIVFIARPQAAAADYHRLGKTVAGLLARGRLLQRSNEANNAGLN